MATAEIHPVGPTEFPLIVDLYGRIFRPPQDEAFFHRRLDGRRGVLMLVAELEGQPVGFSCGYELRPSTYYAWLCGVLPDARRLGVGTQLMAGEQAWARENGYEMMRLECNSGHRPMLQIAISDGYEIIGLRWDSRTASNLVIFEKSLIEAH